MEDYRSVIPTEEGKRHVIAAAWHITKALVASDYVTDDLRKILTDLDSHLSAMPVIIESEGLELSEFERQLKQAEEDIMTWETNQAMIWDSDPMEAPKFVKFIDEILVLIESLRSLLNEYRKAKELLHRADRVLQLAMSWMEGELIHLLIQHKQFFEPKYMSFRCCVADVVYDESFVSVEEEPEEASQRNRSSNGNESERCTVDLVHPHAIPRLKSIANVMFASNYGQEFCQAFINMRKDALDEYLVILRMENFSIEDILKMEWKSLNHEIRKWCCSMKIIIRVYLASEKKLCDQIFGDMGAVNTCCFIETSKASIAYLLNFGEAVVMGTHQPEKLFRLLDMYEVLGDLLMDIDSLYSEDSGSDIRIEFHKLFIQLGDFARATLAEFGNAIASNTATSPFLGGGIHPLTKYVMNYIKTLMEYVVTLNLLLKYQDAEYSNPVLEHENEQGISSSTSCPMALHLLSITSTLEANLENRSKLYKDAALQHVFLMNNFHYIVGKVKDSKLRYFFGDAWIRQHIAKVQQHATSYVRASWSSVLLLLKVDGSLSKSAFKERCRCFNVAFEDVYKNQTGWCIRDQQLREDLQISTSQKVVLAYRNFIGRNSAIDSEKIVKYPVEDLENYLLDLFGGSPRSLHNTRRK
ncbi:exocyst complex component EXO70E2 isoform X1 [Ziziphus jujuba]|uniref:Exocyst subunit Exo70 family protein n=2 Tax=Ziziphus jujuba TaxID=326968 RepID=A0A6P4A4W9_ZIZJJ|nr:exocyst complex component EXO70E2 isoform X1 [Ziziphus jujuba]